MITDQHLIEIIGEIISDNTAVDAAALLVEVLQETFKVAFETDSYSGKGNIEIKKIIDIACEKHFG